MKIYHCFRYLSFHIKIDKNKSDKNSIANKMICDKYHRYVIIVTFKIAKPAKAHFHH